MIGQRGIPALFGGPERHVEELAVRLVQRGHSVTVYTRPSYSDPSRRLYCGVDLVSLPSIATKHLDAISHTLLCTLHGLWSGADVFHFHAEGPGLFCWLPRLAGRGVVVTLHGQDWRREKWGPFARFVLRLGEWVSAKVPHATICVSRSLADEIEHCYGHRTHFIPNGVALTNEDDDTVLTRHGIERGNYVLFAARLVPEKGCHYLLSAWASARPRAKLVVAGDSGFSDDYVAGLKAGAPANVVFVGWVYGAQLACLFRQAALFVLPSDIEGMPIAMLEALGYGTPVLASDIPEIVEVLGNFGARFKQGSVEDLCSKLDACLNDLPACRERARVAQRKILEGHDWDEIAGRLLALYESIVGTSTQFTR